MAYKRFAIQISVMEADGRTALKSKILKVFPYFSFWNRWGGNIEYRQKVDGRYAKEWLVNYILSDRAIVKIPDHGSIIKYDIVEGYYA